MAFLGIGKAMQFIFKGMAKIHKYRFLLGMCKAMQFIFKG